MSFTLPFPFFYTALYLQPFPSLPTPPTTHIYVTSFDMYILFVTTDEDPGLGQNIWLILRVPSLQSLS